LAAAVVIRRHSLTASMSQYLIDRVTASDRIDVATSTEVKDRRRARATRDPPC
jgi:hypothetical protein